MLMTRGARGQFVVKLQRELREAGAYLGPIDGIFGAATERAVRQVQRWSSLKVDGLVGPRTIAQLQGGFDALHVTVPGRNETLFSKVGNIQRFRAAEGKTFCNLAFNAYAKKLGFTGFRHRDERRDFIANEMHLAMKKNTGEWKQVSGQEAIAAAQEGKLVAASWYNNRAGPGRDGKAPGHVAMVIGEYSRGVPGIAQAGASTFAWGPVTRNTNPPTYFVYQRDSVS